jgi:hypothetical protein
MIEIELFNSKPFPHQGIRIWKNGCLVCAIEINSEDELMELRNNVRSELRWLDRYLMERGLYD